MKLIKTCNACPEQYDVLDEHTNEPIAYIRFRFGQLKVCPYINGEIDFSTILLEKTINDDYLGVIPDELRSKWMGDITIAINKYYNI